MAQSQSIASDNLANEESVMWSKQVAQPQSKVPLFPSVLLPLASRWKQNGTVGDADGERGDYDKARDGKCHRVEMVFKIAKAASIEDASSGSAALFLLDSEVSGTHTLLQP